MSGFWDFVKKEIPIWDKFFLVTFFLHFHISYNKKQRLSLGINEVRCEQNIKLSGGMQKREKVLAGLFEVIVWNACSHSQRPD